MAIIQWKDCYSTSVAEFDEEHKDLVAMINNLYEAMRDHREQDVQQGILSSLMDYVATHLEHEESRMEELGYPDLVAHKQAHDLFRKDVATLEQRQFSDESQLVSDMYHLLRSWLLDHIVETDRKYASFFCGESPQ